MFKHNAGFKPLIAIISLLFLLFLWANLSSAIIYVVNSESRTISRIDTATDIVQNNFAQLGIIPNKVIVDDNFLWSVNSGDNALQKISRQTGTTLANILIESGCNPWDAVQHEGYMYVTGLFTDKVYKVNLSTNTVYGFVNVGISPEALCVYNGVLFVTNTGGYQNNYANSSVSVIDLNSFQLITTIPVSPNPQYIIESEGLIHVSCTGNWVSTMGAVCVIDPIALQMTQTINLGGSLGNIWVKGLQAFVSDAGGYNLYSYNADDYSIINGSSNPLSPGGSVIWGDNDLIALLYPNWGNSGKVKILHPDLTFWKEYTVGMTPTDLKFWMETSSLTTESQPNPIKVTVFPNPAQMNSEITFVTGKAVSGKLSIYNIKGQQILSQDFTHSKAQVLAQDIIKQYGSGQYLYKITSPQGNKTGKLLIVK
jgi:hypothetical protein